MEHGKRFAYPIMMLVTIVAVHQCLIRNCVYDIGPCAFIFTLHRYRDALQREKPELAALLAGIRFPLPAWHRYMHRASCQALYAWCFIPGAGVMGAECCEQAWAALQRLAGRLKRMSKVRKLTVLETFWEIFNDSKQVLFCASAHHFA